MIRALDMRKKSVITSFIVVLAVGLFAGSAFADDRDLLRESAGEPYVFLKVDTSGSMHWTPPCTEDDARSDIDPWDGHCTSVCPFDDPQCARICPDQGCIDYAQDASASTPIEVIVDDEAATFTGDWDPSSGSGGYNNDYLFLSAGELGDITYTANLPEDGEYHVYVRWIRRSHRAENVKTTINHADGSNYLEIDQSDATFADSFNYMGTFRFESATAAQVIISNRDADGGSASADAVRFSRLPPPTTGLICNATGYRCQQPLCPQGDCQAPMGADDPTSKFFQARQAIYEVLGEVPDVNFGFGSFEQDQAAILFKHYLYRVADQSRLGLAQDTLNDLLPIGDQVDFTWPRIGGPEVLGTGAPYNATSGVSDDGRMYDCDGQFNNPGDAGYDDDDEIGCTPQRPADVEDIWEMDRLARIPKLGNDGVRITNVYVRDTDGEIYRIRYEPSPLGTYSYGDDTFGLQIDFELCENEACTDFDPLITDHEILYDFVGEYSEWQGRAERYPQRSGGFFDNEAGVQATNTCNGLEENVDLDDNNTQYGPFTTASDDDAWWGYAFKHEWRQDPRGDTAIDGTVLATRVPYLDYGDIIPLDWDHKNTEHVRRRLAPNAYQLTAGSTATNSIVEYELTGDTPDFRTAAYFSDTYDAQSLLIPSRRRLQLRDESERPLYARGSTPLYASLADFAEWYAGPSDCDPTLAGGPPCGWRGYAEVFDLSWACKRKYVLLITDGDETCDPVSDACDIALSLRDNLQVNTFVVGYGLAEGTGNALQCIASNGGTGEPIYPRNKDELVEELLNVFDQVKAESRAFASASIPAVQSTAAEKIYLSSFIPVPGSSIWPGRVDAFRQPLPLTDDRRPAVSIKCGVDGRESACHLWDVGEQILDQAPTDPGNTSLEPAERFEIRIGRDDDTTTADEGEDINVRSRRVFYGQENSLQARPGPLRLLWPPDRQDNFDGAQRDRLDLADMIVPQDDLSVYYSCDPGTEDCTTQEIALDAALQEAVKNIVSIKEENLEDEQGNSVACVGDPEDPSNTPCRYVMGDVFHSNPVVITGPSDFDFFRQDLCGTPPLEGQPNNCVPAEEFDSANSMRARGYREFARRNVWRRRMLATATNDGQMHFFDAGKYIQVDDDDLGEIEVFTDGSGYELFSYMPRMAMPIVRDQADGNRHIFSLDGTPRIDDVFIDPVPDESGDYSPVQREWRTVMVAGMREAGDTFNSPSDVVDFESGYFALDITYPDAVVPATDEAGNARPFAPYVPINPGKFLPDCLDVDDESGRQEAVDSPECRSLSGELTPFPMELWVFQDTVRVGGTSYFVDDDRNGFRDLGATWSVPVIGQIAVCKEGGTRCAANPTTSNPNSDVETRWVAIFGGGLDAGNINNPQRGNWIYMVDMETGEALYRRRVDGAVPSDPAVLDVNTDGIIDRVYFGTTAGTMYKIDLTASDGGDVPAITTETLADDDVLGWTAAAGEDDTVDVLRVTSSAWDPFPIFSTGSPIFYPPSTFRIPELQQYGLAFGVGAREDLWEESGFEGGFFVIVDQNFTAATSGLPFTRDELVQFDWQDEDPINAPPLIGDGNLLLLDSSSGFRAGWNMQFPPNFKTTSEAFVLSTILVFSVFDPLTISVNTGDPDSDAVCAQTGTTYSFVVSLLNGGGLVSTDDDDDGSPCGNRGCEQIGEFTTAIHVDDRSDHNAPPSGSSQTVGTYTGSETDDDLSFAIRETVLGLSPRSCQFNEKYELLVSALRNSTGVNVYATIPLLVCPGDWKQ